MAITLTFIVFWAMTPCSLLEIYRHSEDGHGLFLRSNRKVQTLKLTYRGGAVVFLRRGRKLTESDY